MKKETKISIIIGIMLLVLIALIPNSSYATDPVEITFKDKNLYNAMDMGLRQNDLIYEIRRRGI